MRMTQNLENLNQQDQTELVNTVLQNEMGIDIASGMQMLSGFTLALNIISIVFFITTALWLYKMSKKLGDKHSWLAFVPLIQLYTLIKTAGYSFWAGFWRLIAFGIWAFIVWVVFMWMVWFAGFALFTGSTHYGLIISLGILAYIMLIFLMTYITTYFLNAGMARRAGQSKKTAVLMTLFPWCMYLIVAKRMGNAPVPSQWEQSSVGTTQNSVYTEEL